MGWFQQKPKKNYRDGSELLKRGHSLKCGILRINEESHTVSVIAFCLQMSAMTSASVEIKADITENGKIISVKYSCKATSNGRCKHAHATLLFCVD